ncbi:AHH domain-containing protein [Pseudomonas sp. NFR16]|uniref:AHH domain-containing protein n=1 Tax=Pseudomonas sp. NFR16 TaxID=1566248 RepID=UPI00210CE6BD|nr:AHH domain-containing protein [Pseudomonas sp. NFR16]
MLPKYAENHPTRTVHRGSHPAYNAEVRGNLNEVERVGRQQGWTKAQYKEAVDGVISENRQGLRKGEIKLNKNSIRKGAC